MSNARFDSVSAVGGGGGMSQIFMIYQHHRAYPTFRLTYIDTSKDAPPSPHALPTDVGPPSPQFSTASPSVLTPHAPPPRGPDLFAVYLRPNLPLATSQWASGWAKAAEQQQAAGWGGLHVTMCSFAPNLSSGQPGHHGGSLRGVLQAMLEEVQQVKGSGQRWQLSARHPVPYLYTRGTCLMVALPASRTLTALTSCVLKHAMVNARAVSDLHVTLGDPAVLPGPPNGAAFPACGAKAPLPPELIADLIEANWTLTITKLAGGRLPSQDNERLPI